MKHTKTYCRICEPQCGLIATTEDGRLTKIRANPNHVHSKGHICIKASAAIDVVYDKDRVLSPLKRTGGPGEFSPVTWDEALDDIVDRLSKIRHEHGDASFATAVGNPGAFSYATNFFLGGFQETLNVKWKYGANGDDGAARQVANHLLYGSIAMMPRPDVWQTNYLLIIGANPKVAHSSTFSEPQLMSALRQIPERGGRVVVIDPRRTETAREFDHVPILAGRDAYFLLGMLRTIIDEQLFDHDFIAKNSAGFNELTEQVRAFDIDDSARQTGISQAEIQELAREFANADGAAIYCRTGTCTQKFGTLANVLMDTLVVITGNLERKGGNGFGWSPIDFTELAEKTGWASYNRTPTRVFEHPDVFGMHPSSSLIPDITVPGKEQVRALMTVASNIGSSSAAAGPAMDAALASLDLHFSLDFYVNETNKFADYILPAPTFYERDDFPLLVMPYMINPALWYGPPVVETQGEARAEWEVMNEICRRMGKGGAYNSAAMRILAKLGITITPTQLLDLFVRTSAIGDKFGIRRSGLTVAKIKAMEDGVAFERPNDTVPLRDRLRTADKRVQLCAPELKDELKRLRSQAQDPAFPMSMFGRREAKSINSWLHNAERVMSSGRTAEALINPNDGKRLGLVDRQKIRIRSKSGMIVAPVKFSDTISEGQVSVPHGWGHSGGWRRANDAGGANPNHIANAELADIEPLAGMSVFNGIPVTIEAA